MAWLFQMSSVEFLAGSVLATSIQVQIGSGSGIACLIRMMFSLRLPILP